MILKKFLTAIPASIMLFLFSGASSAKAITVNEIMSVIWGSPEAQSCQGLCWHGATCSDFCPSRGYCVGFYQEKQLLWKVTSCTKEP